MSLIMSEELADQFATAPCIDKWYIYDLPTSEHFPDPRLHQMEKRARLTEAIQLCRQCPVINQCAAEGIRNHDIGVIRAGRMLQSAADVRVMARELRIPA